MTEYFIKNWELFQHFKDRTPPWIKLYRTLLDDKEWHDLEPEPAKTLVMLWLIASEDKTHKGRLPDVQTLAFRLRIIQEKMEYNLSKLSHWVGRDDIGAISARYRRDTPETETETEKRRDRGETDGNATHHPASDFSLDDCKRAASTIGMTDEMISEFYANYASVGWIDAAGRKITNLPAALAKWKSRQSSHGRQYRESAEPVKLKSRIPA